MNSCRIELGEFPQRIEFNDNSEESNCACGSLYLIVKDYQFSTHSDFEESSSSAQLQLNLQRGKPICVQLPSSLPSPQTEQANPSANTEQPRLKPQHSWRVVHAARVPDFLWVSNARGPRAPQNAVEPIFSYRIFVGAVWPLGISVVYLMPSKRFLKSALAAVTSSGFSNKSNADTAKAFDATSIPFSPIVEPIDATFCQL